VSLSPWTSAEGARLHYAALLAAAEEYRLAQPLRDRARRDRAGPLGWRGLVGRLVRHLAPANQRLSCRIGVESAQLPCNAGLSAVSEPGSGV
jgi:hypothetical protein